MKIAFIGLGVMGFPMAGYLAKAKHEVTVYNRTAEKSQRWVEAYGGKMAASPAEAAKDAQVVITMVGNDSDVREVLTGPQGALQSLPAGGLVIDHTTASATLALELAEACKAKGHTFIDAPVSGGQSGAENATLTIMVGGSEDAFQRAEHIFDVYGKTVTRIGPVGHGQMCKMVNQICIAGAIAGVAEGLHLGSKCGLDMEKVVRAVSGGSGQSWQLENRWKTMLADKYDFGFAVDWLRKDLGIALEQGHKVGANLPMTQEIDGFYADIQQMGGNRWDVSSLLRRLQRRA